MTTPDRQDDGLLPCPFCGSKAVAWMYDDVLFGVDCNGCSANVSGFDQNKQDAIDAWNTRAPSRDAVEGADWKDDPSADERWQAGLDFGMLQLCSSLGVDPKSVTWDAATETLDGDVSAVIWNILRAKMGDDWDLHAAPPKPAPDAVQGTIDEIRTILATCGFLNESEATRLGVIAERCDAILSAPMPPADEAQIPTQIIDQLFKQDDLFTARAVYARLKNFGYTLSPSPAVVAEPEAWRWHWIGGDEPDVWGYSEAEIKSDKHRVAEPLYAAPPVRGDREAIARIIEPCGWHHKDRGTASNQVMAQVEDSLSRADAILSLCVQPGVTDKTKFFSILSHSIPSDMIDGIWQELKEAGVA